MKNIVPLCLLMLAAAARSETRPDLVYTGFAELRAMPPSAELPAPPRVDPGVPAAAPDRTPKPRPATLCFLRRVEKDQCVYACRNGREYRSPVRLPEPGDRDTPVIACPQVVIPF